MAQEIELKLSFQSIDQLALTEWLSQKFATPTVTELGNRYFDTPDGALSEQKVALRIRSHNDHHTMTLKTAGQSSGGIHQRQEFDWPVASSQLDLSVLAEQLNDQPLDQLVEQFSTNFTRYAWIIEFQHSEIELVLDTGAVSANNQSDPIFEIELELLSGLAAELYELAEQVCRQFALLPNNVSKAQRGYRLLTGAKPLLPCQDNDVSKQLNAFTDALERFGFDGDLQAWQMASIALANLRLLSITDASHIQSDVVQLGKLCHPVLALLPATLNPQAHSASIKNRHEQLLANPLLGQTLLSLAQGQANETS